MPQQPPPEFWEGEEEDFWEILLPIIILALLAGGDAGIDLLPDDIKVLVNVDLFNQAALDFLAIYRLSTIAGISETTRRLAMQMIEDWIRANEALPSLIARLETLFTDPRARAIAVTEVTRIYSEGNQMMWRTTGVVGSKRWMTAEDELVCPICRPLNGQVVPLDGNFFIPVEGAGGLGVDVPIAGPPAHVNGRCWLTPIVDPELVAAKIERILANA